MTPTLEDGDYVLIKKPGPLKPGLIYLVEHSDLGRIVKRLDRIDHGQAHLKGDSQNSTPSSVMGPIEAARFKGRVWAKIGKSGLRFSL